MRIFTVCENDLSVPHGPVVGRRGLTRAWAELGHEVVLFAPRGRVKVEGRPAAGEPVPAARCHGLAGGAAAWAGVRFVLVPAPPVRVLGPAFYQTRLGAALLCTARREGVPDVLTANSGLYLYGAVRAACLWRKDGCRTGVHLHGVLPRHLARAKRSWPIRLLALRSEKLLCRCADAVFAVGEEVREDAVCRYPEIAERAYVVANAADPKLFYPRSPAALESLRRRLGLSGETPVVGFVGTFDWWYALEVVVRAWPAVLKEHPRARLLLAGFGEREHELRRAAAEVGDSIIFPGTVSLEEVPLLMNLFEVALLPLRIRALPLKLFEYWACGRAVLAAEQAECLEFAARGALRCAPLNEPAAWARELTTLLKEPKLRRNLGRAGRTLTEKHYTWRRTAREMLDILTVAPSPPSF